MAGGYKGWQGLTRGDKGLHGITRRDRGLQGVKCMFILSKKASLLTSTSPNSFSRCILDKAKH